MQNTLKPALKKGSSFNKIIPNVGCEKVALGTGNTFHTVAQMKKWVVAKNWQVAKLAPLLKKSTTQETINSVHKFLCNHLPYRADGALQQIASPSCAWHSRNENAFDCKTFSVFASCILTQLGIPHAIRQIRQYGFKPNLWTHVYVVVPKNPKTKGLKGNNYWVLDGTVKNNTEGYFVEVKDEFMELQHVGLGRPCNVQTTRPVMVAPKVVSEKQKAYAQFIHFLNILHKCGVSQNLIVQIKSEMDRCLQSGNNPKVSVCGSGISINNRPFYFSSGLNGTIKDQAGDFLKQTIEDAKQDVTGKAQGWIDEIFTKIGDFFKCIGSSASPETARQLIDNSIGYIWTSRLNNIAKQDPKNGTNIGKYFDILARDLAVSKAYFDFHASQSKECGQKANKSVADFVRKLEAEIVGIIDIMRSDYDITVTPKTIVASDPTTNGVSAMTHNWKGQTVRVTYNYVTFKLKPGSQGNIPIGGGTSTGSSTGSSTGNTNTTPAGYNSWDSNAKWLYERKLRDGNTSYYFAWIKNNQNWRGPSSFYAAMGVKAPTSNNSSSGGSLVNVVGSTKNTKTNPTSYKSGDKTPTQAGAGKILGFALAALVAGKLYKDHQEKNKKKPSKVL